MCNQVDMLKSVTATGLFRKGNEPEALSIKIDVASCACGQESWAKVKGNHVWVLAERVVDENAIDRMVSADIEHAEHGI